MILTDLSEELTASIIRDYPFRQHCVTSKKTAVFILLAMRTADLTKLKLF
jgi:hypothetical protein